jgi:hypothetical protein
VREKNNIKSTIGLFSIVSIIVFGGANSGCKSMTISNQHISKESVRTAIAFVPNEETAIKIAEAIWLPIYGEEVYEKKPYRVSLSKNKVWIVKGTLPKNSRGGVPYIEIRKSDCKILTVTHGR